MRLEGVAVVGKWVRVQICHLVFSLGLAVAFGVGCGLGRLTQEPCANTREGAGKAIQNVQKISA